jgi:hypothetical protein
MRDFFQNTFTGFFVGLITGGFLLIFGVNVMISNERDTYWQKQAIERDYGEFCSRTGKWAWIGECEE